MIPPAATWSSLALALAGLGLVAGCGGGDDAGTTTAASRTEAASGPPVRYAQVQTFFNRHCVSCHPAVNPSLDLRPGRSYADIVGKPALEAPGMVRVVAGDPDASFLYLKVNGFPELGDIPAIGTRMPPMAPRLPESEIRILRDWIAQGAKNARGETVSASAVPVAGARPRFTGADPVQVEIGNGTIVGRVIDQRRRPIAGAIVTLLLKGSDLPDGEEHVRAAFTDAQGRYRMPDAPEGRLELKAYAPERIYVSRVIEVPEDGTARADFGLPDRPIANPTVSGARVAARPGGVRLSMRLDGFSLDRNYTVAVNVAQRRVYELRALTGPGGETRPGVWRRDLDGRFRGPWVFLAVDETCNVSRFLRTSSP
jgi:hypothetical protein